jgi:hypothetical protein
MKQLKAFAALSSLIVLAEISTAVPLGTAFTYQGRLTDGGLPANGVYEVRLGLWDAGTAGSQVAVVTNVGVLASNGLFTTAVDFGGGIFNGTAYWMELSVRTNASLSAFTPLSPRQPVTPSPYSLFASGSPLADGSVTSAKILDGTVAAVDLAPNSINSTHIIDGQVTTADLAADAVTSAKVLNGSLVGADLANNTVGSDQLADTIALGRSNVIGQLDVFFANTASNQPSISLMGGSSRISTYGSDGQEQVRLWGVSYGEILLYDSTVNNNVSATLTANSSGGGFLELNRGNTNREGLQLFGGTSLGGEAKLFTPGNQLAMDARAEFSASFPGAWLGLYHTNQERVSLAAQNGTSGRGGLIDVKNNSTLNTIRLIGDTGGDSSRFEMYAGGTNLSFEILANDSSAGSAMFLFDGAGSQRVEIDSDDGDDGAIIRLRNSSGATTITLDADFSGDGRITTQELQITGGSDLSEQFDITALDEAVKPGMVVCIDPRNPGRLIPSTRAYDRTVAGVISGAGGVKPGMLMGQKGTAADGQHPVALTGRVYAMVDATYGSIEPGDLLTTSDTAGHAKKVTDPARAQGAILGKAMTPLNGGKGLVLVLVALQ